MDNKTYRTKLGEGDDFDIDSSYAVKDLERREDKIMSRLTMLTVGYILGMFSWVLLTKYFGTAKQPPLHIFLNPKNG